MSALKYGGWLFIYFNTMYADINIFVINDMEETKYEQIVLL